MTHLHRNQGSKRRPRPFLAWREATGNARSRKKEEADMKDDLEAIEDKLAEIQALSEFLLATRILHDGHAGTMEEAIAIARDLDRASALYPK